jgi:ABC-type sulfate transport system substrate-binding protein
VILVRPGTRKKILDFADLARPVSRSSIRSADVRRREWAISEYGAGQRANPKRIRQAPALSRALGQRRGAGAARAARTQFERTGSATLVTYEQEAIPDARAERLLDIAHPRRTVMSEHTLVLVDRNLKGPDRAPRRGARVASLSEPAQIFVVGFRA